MKNEIEIETLYNNLVAEGRMIKNNGKYELIDATGIKVLSYNGYDQKGRYVPIKYVSRHKTNKHLIKITVKNESLINSLDPIGQIMPICQYEDIVVTTDHICMTFDRDRILQNVNADNLQVGDYVSTYDINLNREVYGVISNIKDLGFTDNYVYDLEIDDNNHCFYANDILIHNSIFLNLEPVTSWMKKEYSLPDAIKDWKKKDKQQLWKTVSTFVSEDVNGFVRGLAHDFCKTSKQDILTYELEYLADVGVYERKKHYATHKIFDEGDPVDKIKYSGIEMKKGSLPKFVKKYLQEIYEGVILKGWTDQDYLNYINDLYDKFKSFSIDEISFFKGYNTEREASGFLQMAQSINPTTGKTIGTTGIAKAATFFNQIIQKMNLGKKYESIRLGDKCRFLYIDENNPYHINVMAYKDGQWPEEFNNIFKPDYKIMFEKTVLDALKAFRQACKFSETDPSKQVAFDIFSI
jgi:hypothetical protein